MGTRVLGKDSKAAGSLLCSKEARVMGKCGMGQQVTVVWGLSGWRRLRGTGFGREVMLPLAAEWTMDCWRPRGGREAVTVLQVRGMAIGLG